MDGQVAGAAERVVRHVRARLLAGELAPGQRLAPERELAAALGVSRPSLREGLRALSLLGLIDIRHGHGTFVCEPDPEILRAVTTMALAHLPDAMEDAMQARIAIECQAIRIACARVDGADVREIEARLDGIVTSLDDPVAGGIADHAFHSRIVTASRCAPLVTLYEAIADLLRPLHVERRRETVAVDGIRNYLVEAHREVFAALVQRDPDKADRQLRAHFEIGEDLRRQGQVNGLAHKYASYRLPRPEGGNQSAEEKA